MEDKAISVLIADRQYKLTVDKEEYETVRKAARLIDQKVREYAQNYAFKDKQDLLAMIALQFTTGLLTEESKQKAVPEDLIKQLQDIDTILKNSL